MDYLKTKYNGEIHIAGQNYKIEISYRSQFTLNITFLSGHTLNNNSRGEKVTVTTNNTGLEFGEFTLYLDNTDDTQNGYLVFNDDLYDFNIFFKDGNIIDLEKQASNLELVLSQKDQISDVFKIFTADLVYDVTTFKQYYDNIDEAIKKENNKIKQEIESTILKKENKKFIQYMSTKFKQLEELVAGFNNEQHKSHGSFLRKQLWEFMVHSEFIKRTNLKPRGYAGDSEMMIMIYNNEFVGDTIFAKLLNKFPLEDAGANAVRNRRFMVPKMINKYYETVKQRGKDTLNFLSVACGPAFELNDIFRNQADTNKYNCFLLDQDENAIKEATETIGNIEKKLKTTINHSFIKDSVRTMLLTKDLASKWGTFDYIYSMGLFDYLTPPVGKVVIEKLYSLLVPGGQLLIGNFHTRNTSRWIMEYLLDWPLFYRQEEDFRALLRDTDAENINVSYEDQGVQMFLSANKPM